MKKRLLIFACLLTSLMLHGQTTKQEVIDNPGYASGHYSTYPAPTEQLTPAPDGYVPVYLSHYGRHGSRYHTNLSHHTNAYKILKSAKDADMLTPLGKSVYKRVRNMRRDAKGRDGGLSSVGVQEHRDIAERMFKTFPEIFAGNAIIQSRATESARCILSMAANNERLKELNPALRTYRSAYEGDENLLRRDKYQKDNKKEIGGVKKTLLESLDVSRFIGSLFNGDVSSIMDEKAQSKFMKHMFGLYQIAGCTAESGVRFDDIFTPEELFFLWRAGNAGNYAQCGNSKKFGKGVIKDAVPLLKDIIGKADEALDGKGVSADLRFGHDVGLAPLAALMNINGTGVKADATEDIYNVWADFKVMPMAANLQMVLYRNADGHVLVKFLYNERECEIPGLATSRKPYYDWKDVRAYLSDKVK